MLVHDNAIVSRVLALRPTDKTSDMLMRLGLSLDRVSPGPARINIVARAYPAAFSVGPSSIAHIILGVIASRFYNRKGKQWTRIYRLILTVQILHKYVKKNGK